MELRHLRYFIAVAEEGSLTVAAEKRLHTAQPSLSRQIRDLEYEVGVPLFARSVHGVELTAAGRAFLDHARLALTQADAAIEAARRAGRPEKSRFALGFLTGQEIDWLPEAMRVLRDELPNIDVTVTSDFSPALADGLRRGSLDLAFMRREASSAELVYKTVIEEALVAVLPSDHRLAKLDRIDLAKLEGTPFVNVSDTAPELLKIINSHVRESGLPIRRRMMPTTSPWRCRWWLPPAASRCSRATSKTSCPGPSSAVRSGARRRRSISSWAITKPMPHRSSQNSSRG